MKNRDVYKLLKEMQYPPLSEHQKRKVWKSINEKLFAAALLEFKNEIVDIRDKVEVSRKSHEQGMKGSNSLSLPWHWHQGYRDADTWIGSLLDKAFSGLGKKIMGIDPIGLPLQKERKPCQ